MVPLISEYSWNIPAFLERLPASTKQELDSAHPIQKSAQAHTLFGARVFKLLIRPAPLLQRHIDSKKVLANERYIAVHMRVGLGLKEHTQYKRFNYARLGMDNAVARCAAITAVNHAKARDVNAVYIPSDTPVALVLLKAKIRKLYPTVRTAHSDKPARHVKTMESRNPGDREASLSTLVELAHLANADMLISLPSGFARFGAMLAASKEYSIINLEQCYTLKLVS